MDRYVDVLGEATFTEQPSRYVAEVAVEAQATKQESALDEAAALRTAVVESLKSSGIEEAEIVEGGAALHFPWYAKRNVTRSAERRIILKVGEYERLSAALDALEPLHAGERRTVAISMRQPEFDAGADARADALAMAFSDARSKARRLAVEMGLRLGRVIHLEEGRTSLRRSGFMGDEDFSGDTERFTGGGRVTLDAVGAAGGMDDGGNGAIALENPTRELFVTCRARFALVE